MVSDADSTSTCASTCPSTPGLDSPLLDPKKVPEADAAKGQEAAVAKQGVQPVFLPPWAVEEAVWYFKEKLCLEAKVRDLPPGDQRAEMCNADFRSLVEGWQPSSTTFWQHCATFSKKWAPDGFDPRHSPRSRPLSAGKLQNYLTRLSRSSAPSAIGGKVELWSQEEACFPPEVCVTAQRFGIRLSDIRVTCASVFEVCKAWTGLDWEKDHATDPCPWPVPPGLDGLACSWRQLAAASGHKRIYMNPPWSKLDQWLYKAVLECCGGLSVLAVLPAWVGDFVSDIKQFVAIIDQQGLRRRAIEIRSRVLWDAEFAHPTTGQKMPPLNVMLIWLQ